MFPDNNEAWPESIKALHSREQAGSQLFTESTAMLPYLFLLIFELDMICALCFAGFPHTKHLYP